MMIFDERTPWGSQYLHPDCDCARIQSGEATGKSQTRREVYEGTSMNRRDLLAASAGLTLTGFPFRLAFSPQASEERNHASDRESNRHPVLVRSGFTRKPNGTDERAPSPSGMFDTEVVRSSDSEGRLAVFVIRQENIAPIGAPRFTCITNRMNGSMS